MSQIGLDRILFLNMTESGDSILLDGDSQSGTIQNLYTVNENQELRKDVQIGYKKLGRRPTNF